jgi:hypothetical protein
MPTASMSSWLASVSSRMKHASAEMA